MCDYKFSDGSQIPYIGLSPRGDVSLKDKYDFSAPQSYSYDTRYLKLANC
jgi:hypothetical protein